MSILDFLTQSLQLLEDGRVWFVSLGLFPLYYFVADDKRKLDKTNIPQVSLPNTSLPATPAKELTAPQAAAIPLLSTPQTEMARLKQTL